MRFRLAQEGGIKNFGFGSADCGFRVVSELFDNKHE